MEHLITLAKAEFSSLTLSPLQIAALILALVLIGILVSGMRTKRFYIVRHGRTLLNEQEIKQGAEGGLSEAGIRQAHAVGAAFKELHVQKILTSPYERARQTANIIASYLKVSVKAAPLLAERKNPSEVVGKSTHDPEVERIMGLTVRAFHEDNLRYSDEENFLDLKRRARKCLAYLGGQGGTRFCIVTHHAFLHMLLSYMLHREKLHAPDYVKLSFFNPAENGGITVCEYHPWRMFSATRGWEILTYNQQLPETAAKSA